MKTLSELKKEKEDKIGTLITDCGMFFAFSNEQFNANKTPLKEGEKYVHLGAGAYLPKGQVDNYLNGVKAISKEFTEAVRENKQRRANILYELNNYECFYTGDIEDAINALGSDYTIEEVQEVYNIERKKAA